MQRLDKTVENPPFTMQGAAPFVEQVSPLAAIFLVQHEFWPLPRPEQPSPPHVPHEACCGERHTAINENRAVLIQHRVDTSTRISRVSPEHNRTQQG